MKTRSAKAKGRRACQSFVDELLKAYPQLNPEDLVITPSSINGVDIVFSRFARETIGFNFAPEVKNQEKLSIWAAIAQAEKNAKEDQMPIIVFTKNNKGLHVSVRIRDFVRILKGEKLCPTVAL